MYEKRGVNPLDYAGQILVINQRGDGVLQAREKLKMIALELK